ncbi:MAG: VirB4 family type IV secretion system protein [Candidatus Dormibacteria bacterium]
MRSRLERGHESQPLPVVGGDGDPAVFSCSGLERHCIVRTGPFDLLEAGPETTRVQLARFSALLGGISGRFQVHVASRWDGAVASTRPALQRFLRDTSLAPGLRHDIRLVVSAAPSPADRVRTRWRSDAAPDIASAARRDAEATARELARMGLRPSVLEGDDLERFIDREVATWVAPGKQGEERGDWWRYGDRLSRGFIVRGYPGGLVEPGWLSPLLEVPVPYDLALHGFRIPAGSALRLLNRRIRDLQSSRLSDAATLAVGDPLTETALPEAMGLRRDVAGNQESVYSVALYMTVEAGDEEELEVMSNAVLEGAERAGILVAPASFQMSLARRATLAIGQDPVRADRLLPGSVVTSLFPWVQDRLQQPQGHFVGRQARGGGPVLIDTFDEERFANANIGVFGHSGAGKTYLVKGLLLSDADAGIAGFVIDPEAEYGEVCDAIGGQCVDMALGSGTSINVLDPALTMAGERDPLGDQVADLLDLLGTMCGALTEDERVDLDIALRRLLVRGGATLRDLRADLQACGAAPRVARSLRRWTEGPMGALFARPTNVSLDADFVVFNLRDLKEEIVPVAYFLIAQWIWARVRCSPQRRRMLFDEVGLVFEYPLVRRFLVRLARRVRKYQGSLVLVTQNAGDLLASDQGLVLATNPSTLFLGGQRPAEAQRLQRAFGLTQSQAEHLACARRGEFLLLAGDGRHRLVVEGNPWQRELEGYARLPAIQEGR